MDTTFFFWNNEHDRIAMPFRWGVMMAKSIPLIWIRHARHEHPFPFPHPF